MASGGPATLESITISCVFSNINGDTSLVRARNKKIYVNNHIVAVIFNLEHIVHAKETMYYNR